MSAAIAGLVLLSTGLVLTLSSQTAWRNTIELLRAQAELAMTLVEEEVRDHVTPALEISRYIHAQVASGQIHPERRHELMTIFHGALAAAPQIAGVVLWDERMRKVELRRHGDGRIEVSNEQDEITPELIAFLDAVRRRGEPAWGAPTEGDQDGNYVHSVTPLNYRGKHWGVMATGVTINNLSAIVKRVGARRGMTAFILYGDYVLAHPSLDDAPVVLGEDGSARLRTIAEVDDAVVSRFGEVEAVNRPRPGEVEIREINAVEGADAPDGRDYLVLSRINRAFGDTPWTIGVYGPTATLGRHFDRLISSGLAGIGVLILAIVCALWIARKISRPIRELADSAERIGMLELSAAGGIAPSGIRELDDQAGAFNRMVEGLRWFETYVPKRLVRRLINQRDGDAMRSREAELSVMFTDIIGFTAFSEKMPPGAVGEMLNAHFEIIARCIEAEGGTLDKYIGDAAMAFWGAPEDQPDHARRACRAALAIARELRAQPYAPQHAPIRIKMAIHSGALLVGNIGATSRMNYTVIGDTVNTCSRIESLCGQFDDGASAIILVSSETVRLSGDDPTLRFDAVGGHEVKGRSDEVHVSRLREADG
ncbi:MAG: adenylate/guanylate cyclase domain-containing protein [bacterium]